MKPDPIQSPPQGHFATVNDIQMYYELHGEGSPLVLLHAFTSAAVDWQPYISDFATQFKLIVPDLRGHGHSTNPTNQFTHRQVALDIFSLLDQLEIKQFKGIGRSSGADVLLHMATQQPARVEAMVLVGAAPYWPEQSRVIYRQTTVDSKIWDWDQLRQKHVLGDAQIRAILEQLHNFKDSYDDTNFTPPYLSTIEAKTLIIHGDRDVYYPVSLAVELYTSIPNAYLWVVPNGDHLPTKGERAKPFTQTALEFLRGNWE